MSKMSLEYVINLLDGTFGKNMQKAQKQTNQLDGLVKKVGASIAGVFAVQKVWGLVEESTQVHAKMEALDVRLKTVSGTTERYAQYNAALGKSIKDLALRCDLLSIRIFDIIINNKPFNGTKPDTRMLNLRHRKTRE